MNSISVGANILVALKSSLCNLGSYTFGLLTRIITLQLSFEIDDYAKDGGPGAV